MTPAAPTGAVASAEAEAASAIAITASETTGTI